jgi:tetratricopeptide (TPR) repeat protein
MPHQNDGRDRSERVEDILRPASYLGYDRDALARHLMACGAFRLSETQFRRAVWLNPFEPAFKQHLALCLCAKKQYAEARDWILEALQQQPDNAENRRILERIEREAAVQESEPGHEI